MGWRVGVGECGLECVGWSVWVGECGLERVVVNMER